MILRRYILKEHISPFFISLLVVTFLLLSDRVIDLLNMIIEKKLPAGIVIEVFTLSLPYMLALAIPMAVLVATILAFGRMSVDREVIAIKSSGINIYGMLGPLFLAGIILTGTMVYFNHWFLPETNHKLKNLMLKIAYYKPMTIIKEGEYTSILDYTIWCDENRDEVLYNVIIYDRSASRYPRLIFAKQGQMVQMEGGNALRIILKDGQMHQRSDNETGKYQVSSFGEYQINVRDLGNRQDFFESGYRSDREMTYQQLTAAIKSQSIELNEKQKELKKLQGRMAAGSLNLDPLGAQAEMRRIYSMQQITESRVNELNDSLRSLKVEYHKKFSLSFAVIIFIMVGVPLGLMTRSSGIGMAFSVSSIIFLIYYVALNGGEQLADKGLLNPFLSMWLSNIVFFFLALALIYGSIKEKRIFDLHVLKWKIKTVFRKKQRIPDEVFY